MKFKTVQIITNPFFIGLIVFLPFLLIFHPVFNKYVTSLESSEIMSKPQYHYSDIDFDGISEMIEIFDYKNSHSIIARKGNGIIEQWNYKGSSTGHNAFMIEDYDRDSLKEIFISTYHNDTIYVHCIDPFDNNTTNNLKYKYVDTLYTFNDSYYVRANFINLNDVNEDGNLDVVFAVISGYTPKLRSIYAWDIYNDSLYEGPKCGASLEFIGSYDFDRDGFSEYFTSVMAPGNIKEEYPYKDDKCWFILYDHDLTFFIPPFSLADYPSYLQTVPLINDTTTRFITLLKNRASNDQFNKLILFNNSGDSIKVINIPGKYIEYAHLIPVNSNYEGVFLLYDNGKVEKYDFDLNLTSSWDIPNIRIGRPKTRIDIDQDGKVEYVLLGEKKNEVIIVSSDLKHPTDLSIDDYTKIRNISVKKREEGLPPLLFIQTDEYGYYFSYKRNPLYALTIPIYISFYFLVSIVLLLLQRIFQYQLKRRFEREKMLSSLQLQVIQNQLSPHFTLNIINSIGGLFYKKDSEKATYVFDKFSRLLRDNIVEAENTSLTLEQEIDRVRNYLELEKFRYDNKFDYIIDIDPGVNLKLKIPKTLIHTFVENAVKHGLKHAEGRGELKIKILRRFRIVHVEVEDNGIGRKAASAKTSFGAGKGLEIMEKILKIHNQLEGKLITFTIDDLSGSDNQPAGTKVTIKIP